MFKNCEDVKVTWTLGDNDHINWGFKILKFKDLWLIIYGKIFQKPIERLAWPNVRESKIFSKDKIIIRTKYTRYFNI